MIYLVHPTVDSTSGKICSIVTRRRVVHRPTFMGGAIMRWAAKLVNNKGFNNPEALRKCNDKRRKDTIKAMRHPGRDQTGVYVSGMDANNVRMEIHQLNIWGGC